MPHKKSTTKTADAFDSWSDYETLTRDVARAWWDVPLRHADEETAIRHAMGSMQRVLEVGAHTDEHAQRLRGSGKTVYTFDVDPHARVDFHSWEKTPKKVDAIIAKQVLEHIPQAEIESWLHRFAEKADVLVFTIPNFWAPGWVFTNDVTHVNNASLRTWTYWLRRAGYRSISCWRLGQGVKIGFVSKLNALLGQSDPCHSILIRATK